MRGDLRPPAEDGRWSGVVAFGHRHAVTSWLSCTKQNRDERLRSLADWTFDRRWRSLVVPMPLAAIRRVFASRRLDARLQCFYKLHLTSPGKVRDGKASAEHSACSWACRLTGRVDYPLNGTCGQRQAPRSFHCQQTVKPAWTVPLGRLIPDPPHWLSGPQAAWQPPGGEAAGDLSVDYWTLLRPRGVFHAEWEPKSDWLSLSSYDLKMQVPTFPIFGSPPPFITAGFSYTEIGAPASYDLPSELYDLALGLSWIRPINDRWTTRLMINGAFASDFRNTGSDAWQLRGGVFAMYRPNEQWNFAVGALATGRTDIPVLPAAGAIWEPSPRVRFDLMLPQPRVSVLLADFATRQHWGYFGGGFTGGTWAYERAGGQLDKLTYREWRLVLGWESMPPRARGLSCRRAQSSVAKWDTSWDANSSLNPTHRR